jgi:hypothetical protein
VHRLRRVRAGVSGGAIYDSVDSTPASQKTLVEANKVYRAGERGPWRRPRRS